MANLTDSQLDDTIARTLHDALAAGDAQVVRTFKDDVRSVVQLVEHEGARWIVKRYRGGALGLRVKRWLGRSPAQREARGAALLAKLGIRCSRPVATWQNREEWIVLPYVDGLSLHHWLRDQEDAELRRRLLTIVGRQAGQLLAAGWVNRDFKPSNLIIDRACEEDGEQPVVIDAVGLRRRTSGQQVNEMLDVFRRACARQELVKEHEWPVLVEAMGMGADFS